MKKKFFGIKIGTILSTLLCLIVAIVFWFFVEYSALDATKDAAEMLEDLTSK